MGDKWELGGALVPPFSHHATVLLTIIGPPCLPMPCSAKAESNKAASTILFSFSDPNRCQSAIACNGWGPACLYFFSGGGQILLGGAQHGINPLNQPIQWGAVRNLSCMLSITNYIGLIQVIGLAQLLARLEYFQGFIIWIMQFSGSPIYYTKMPMSLY